MFIKLTFAMDKSPLRIRYDQIISYQLDDANGSNSIVSLKDHGYQVVETVEQIDELIQFALNMELKQSAWK